MNKLININLISTILSYLDLKKAHEFSKNNSGLSHFYLERKHRESFSIEKAKSLKYECEIGKAKNINNSLNNRMAFN